MPFTFKLAKRLALLKTWRLPAAGILMVLACEIQDRATAPGAVTQIAVSPDSVILAPLQTQQFNAFGRTLARDSVAVAVAWTTSSGSITQAGLYAADTSMADALVTARVPGSQLSATSRIKKRRLAQVVITPATATVTVGGTLQFRAYGLANTGDSLAVAVTYAATGGTITTGGLYTASQVGSSRVTATAIQSGTLLADTATVTVTAVPVASVAVSPAAASLQVGGTVQLTATPKDANGNPLTGRVVTWASSAPAVATVAIGSGLVTGVAAGNATITATSEGQSGTAAITVTAPPAPVATVSVSPASATVPVGGTVQLSATLRDAAGNVLTGRAITWATSSATVATISSSGQVAAMAAGSATITASSEGKSGTAVITVTAPSGTPAVLVGAGDIASCSSSGDEGTATLLDGIPGTVFTAGDNAYPDGYAADFANCYQPSWGRHKARTRPSAGNHDYHDNVSSGAADYFNYFGAAAGDPTKGYYSYGVGSWHVVVLNTNLAMSAGSPQEQWLRADLAATTARCTVAYMHYPRFSSGQHGSYSGAQPLWQALYDYGAEIVVAGHDHLYERFAPQTPTGVADPQRGIREFIAGTGGHSHYSFNTPLPNSEVRDNTAFGVLKLTLSDSSYTWEFVPIAGQTFRDSGSGSCH